MSKKTSRSSETSTSAASRSSWSSRTYTKHLPFPITATCLPKAASWPAGAQANSRIAARCARPILGNYPRQFRDASRQPEHQQLIGHVTPTAAFVAAGEKGVVPDSCSAEAVTANRRCQRDPALGRNVVSLVLIERVAVIALTANRNDLAFDKHRCQRTTRRWHR